MECYEVKWETGRLVSIEVIVSIEVVSIEVLLYEQWERNQTTMGLLHIIVPQRERSQLLLALFNGMRIVQQDRRVASWRRMQLHSTARVFWRQNTSF